MGLTHFHVDVDDVCRVASFNAIKYLCLNNTISKLFVSCVCMQVRKKEAVNI